MACHVETHLLVAQSSGLPCEVQSLRDSRTQGKGPPIPYVHDDQA